MSPGAVEVSAARPEEYAALGEMVVAAYRSVDAVIGDEYAVILADVGGRAADPGVVVLAARLDGVPIGCATVVLDSPEMAEGRGPESAVLRMVGVAPGMQGRGAGRALVEAAVAIAREQGRRYLDLHTQPVMLGAQHMYEQAGFVRFPEADMQIHVVRLLGYRLVL